jgi:hypothetical protein
VTRIHQGFMHREKQAHSAVQRMGVTAVAATAGYLRTADPASEGIKHVVAWSRCLSTKALSHSAAMITHRESTSDGHLRL